MTRRTERICSEIRRTIGEALLSKVADPRINPALTSITAVEISEDLLEAKVFVSVLGDEATQRKTIDALRHAAGYFQELVGRALQLRYTPALTFRSDEQFKKTLATLEVLQRVSEDLERKKNKSGSPDQPSPPPADEPAGNDDDEGR